MFEPDSALLNPDLWTRASETRFECEFLRLAVEWHDPEYVLLEMDGEHRELYRCRQYYPEMGQVIFNMTQNRV